MEALSPLWCVLRTLEARHKGEHQERSLAPLLYQRWDFPGSGITFSRFKPIL
jgi:hypothetical protein